MKIAAIARSPEDSPNMCDKDTRLLMCIAEKLTQRGHSVVFPDEQGNVPEGCHALYHMSRTAATLEKISQCEAAGTIVVNSVEGVNNCSRRLFTEILRREGIAQPQYRIVNTDDTTAPPPHLPAWLKMGNGWSSHPDDVCHITSTDEYTKALQSMNERGVSEAICCEHIEGDIIKFYGISGRGFFRWHYPNPATTKFGLEKHNGSTQNHPFNEEQLRSIAFEAAHAIGIEIFGGDCIVTADGQIYIIDINDFPSFSAYCEEAAEEIAMLIENKIDNERRK
jgi:glutathione synthase/RimK-type ligase-like ATP-grasp enzyme